MGASKMKGSLFFLTPEQINILHSKEKHVVIDCPNGCGKQLIDRNKAKMIAATYLRKNFCIRNLAIQGLLY